MGSDAFSGDASGLSWRAVPARIVGYRAQISGPGARDDIVVRGSRCASVSPEPTAGMTALKPASAVRPYRNSAYSCSDGISTHLSQQGPAGLISRTLSPTQILTLRNARTNPSDSVSIVFSI